MSTDAKSDLVGAVHRCIRRFCFRVAAGVLAITAQLIASTIATAQETPVLIVKNAPPITRWCGDRAAYANSGDDPQILDVFSKRRLKLQFDRSTYNLLQCSPDSRWAVTVRVGTKAEQAADEYDREMCDAPGGKKSPRIFLWDTQQGSHHEVGRGYLDFNWSPDGKMLLYRFLPMCEYEKLPGNSIRIPRRIHEFMAVSTLAMISNFLGAGSGWPNQGRVGVTSWYAPDAFIVQLPDREGAPGIDWTSDGAILSVHLRDGKPDKVEQLNPSGFESSWKLALPQLPPAASDEIVKAGHCEVNPPRNGWRSNMYCSDLDEIESERFRLGPGYCATVKVGDVDEFCSPARSGQVWGRSVRGSTVLVLKPARVGDDLFRIDHDQKGYLK